MTIQWKQIIMALVIGLGLGTTVGVLTARREFRGPPHDRMPGRLERKLDLTPEQHARLKEIRRSTREEIRAILTPEQKRTFDQMKRPGRSRRPE